MSAPVIRGGLSGAVGSEEGAEAIPGKHSDTRMKPLALANGHGRHIAVTPERTLASVGECPSMHGR